MKFELVYHATALAFCGTLLSAIVHAQPNQGAADVIPSDPVAYDAVNRVVAELSAEETTGDRAKIIVHEFMSITNTTSQELLLQLLAVYGGKQEYRIKPRAEMVKRLLISNLLQGMSSSDIVAAVASKYEKTSDAKLQRNFQMALAMVVFKGGRVDPDSSELTRYVEQHKAEPPRRLIGLMYGYDGQSAILSIARVYGGENAKRRIAEELKRDPNSALCMLADDTNWWAHLYVAVMMERNASLRTPELLRKLEQDNEPLVREKLNKLEEQIEPK